MESPEFTTYLITIAGSIVAGIIVVFTKPLWGNILTKYLRKQEIISELKRLKQYPNPMNKNQAKRIVDEMRKYTDKNHLVFGLSLSISIADNLAIIEERLNMKAPQNTLNIAVDNAINAIKSL